jgi:phage terminase large subunit
MNAVATAVQIALPPKLKPVFIGPADVRGAWGGRGSGKTRSFAKMAAVRGYMYGQAGISGIILCARQYMNSLDDSSLEEVKRAIEEEPFLAEYYDVGEKYVRSHDGRIDFSFAGLEKSLASIKSKGRILLCWVDEAEPVTAEAWTTLVPTLREEGSDWNAELWVTWNPKRKTAACESRFRNQNDPLIKVVEINWKDNPAFPAKLERERQRDLEKRPDQYAHVWDGAYVSVIEGAYFAKHLTLARQQGRVGRVAADPLMKIHLFFDIGGTGARADAVTIWAKQFIGREIRALDYYEAVGQPLSAHVEWMRSRGYTPKRSQIWLPHDGDTNDKVHNVSYASALKGDGLGYNVEVVPNQGVGAAKKRIEAARLHFHAIWFNAPDGVDPETTPTTAAGLEALGWYHEKKDEERGIGLGPEHDWSSHGADAFGLGCICADRIFAESDTTGWSKPLKYSNAGIR